jgi:hypothetical protein
MAYKLLKITTQTDALAATSHDTAAFNHDLDCPVVG